MSPNFRPTEEREHFLCPFCAYPFTLKCNLKTHIGRVHKDELEKRRLKPQFKKVFIRPEEEPDPS